MFKSARWRSERSKVRVVFKLQFHAVKVPFVGEDALIVSIVPADAGKPTAKLDKSTVRDGSCLWENPVYETVKFNVDMKSGKFHRKMYTFVVAGGSLKSGFVGEASIDFSNFVDSGDVTLVSLPLKSSKAEAVLNVSIQRMPDSDKSFGEVGEGVESNHKVHSLKSQLSNQDIDETVNSNGDVISSPQAKGSSASDLTISSSGSNSGVEIPWQPEVKSNRFHRGLNAISKNTLHEESCRSQWEWLGNSVLEAGTEDSLSTPRENFMRLNLDEATDNVVENLKSEVAFLSRQAEISELELQNLRKQIIKESKRGQELSMEVMCLKEERDSLRLECKNLRVQERQIDSVKGVGLEDLREELNHEKELNSNLRIQLRKTQESNAELILAVQDLDEMLEQRNQDLVKLKNGSSESKIDEKLHRLASMCDINPENDGKEQQIIGLQSELEILKRDKEDAEMQMEQLALDYEMLKQENHEMANKLQQIRLREQLKTQSECSSSSSLAQELESQIQKLEEKLRIQSSESETALTRIWELETQLKILEDEFDKQVKGFKADTEDAIRCKVEQEKRALVAEESLRKTRLCNAKTADRLQEELRRLSEQMESTFQVNKKLATEAMAEANELRVEKAYLEEMIKKGSEENQQNEIRLEQLACQVSSLTVEIKRLQSEIKDKELQMRDHQSKAGETERLLSDEISLLNKENEAHLTKIRHLCEEMEIMENSKNESEKTIAQMKENEALEKDKTSALENKMMQLRTDSVKSQKEMNQMRHLMEEKELVVINLRSELDSLWCRNDELKNSTSESKLEQENLTKQVSQLKSELKKKEETLISMEKKMKDSIKASQKSSSRSSKEAAIIKDIIKLLQDDVKSKETALEMSNKSYIGKEKYLLCKIQELEERVEKLSDPVHDQEATELRNGHQESNRTSNSHEPLEEDVNTVGENGHRDDEIAQLKEQNRLMEAELKEMQERYSEISLKFAEVEGERQQLVMKVRNLKNARRAT